MTASKWRCLAINYEMELLSINVHTLHSGLSDLQRLTLVCQSDD